MNPIIRCFCILLILAFSNCGGGGGSDDLIAKLEGTWRGNLALIADQCFLQVDPLAEIHQVSIDGADVMLLSTDGRLLSGTATSSTSFEVEISDGAAFPTIDQVAYTSISDGVAQVEVSHIFSRPGGCVTSWSGQMTKD